MIKFSALSIFLIIATSVCHVANAEPESLLQAYQSATQNDAQLQAAKANYAGSELEIPKARAAFLPKIQLSASRGKAETDAQSLTSGNSQVRDYDTKSYNLTLRQPLYNKKAFADYQQAKAQVEKSEANFNIESQNLITRLVEAYLNLLLTQDTLNLAKEKKFTLQEAITQARKKHEKGLGTLLDVNELEANLAITEAEIQEHIHAEQNNRHAYQSVVGVYPEKMMTLEKSKVDLNILQATTQGEWINFASNNSPAIKASKQMVEVAKSHMEAERSAHYPTLEFVASKSFSESDSNITIGQRFDTRSYSVQLNVPIYAGGFVNASVSQAMLSMQEAESKVQVQQRDINAEVRGYYNDTQNAINHIKAYTLAEKTGETLLMAMEKSQAKGQKTIVDVYNAKHNLTDTQTKLIKYYYQYILSYIQLKEAAGMLGVQDLETISLWFVSPPQLAKSKDDN